MKRFILTTGIVLLLLNTNIAGAAISLSDAALAGISGGGVDLPLEGQSLPQEQQQPQTNDSVYNPMQGGQTIDGMDNTPSLFAILQGSINHDRKRVLLLHGRSQQGAVTLNLENLLSSDAISTENIFDASSLSLSDTLDEIEINQGNDLNQLHRAQGSLSTSIAGYRYEETVESHFGSESYDYSAYSLIDQQNWSDLQRRDFIESYTKVGDHFTSLEMIATDALPIEIIEAQQYGPYLGFAGYSGTTFSSLGLEINSLDSHDGNLLLGALLTPPMLDFGTTDLLIFPDWDHGSIGDVPTQIDITLPGMGLQLDELNLGAGFALNGDGNLMLGDSGHFTVNGNLDFELTAYTKLVIDLSKTVLNLDKATLLDESVDLVDLDIDFTLLDIQIDPFAMVPGYVDDSINEIHNLGNNTEKIIDASDVAESSFNDSYVHSSITGGQMTGAEAELLALSDGSLSVDSSNNVVLSDSAQKNMQVINGVNAVSSVAANALNISRMPTFRASPVSVRTSTTQVNSFNQQM